MRVSTSWNGNTAYPRNPGSALRSTSMLTVTRRSMWMGTSALTFAHKLLEKQDDERR
jgi:hypothetical protein